MLASGLERTLGFSVGPVHSRASRMDHTVFHKWLIKHTAENENFMRVLFEERNHAIE
jgi:hypothetical protein